jgi:serine/threonine protein kinase
MPENKLGSGAYSKVICSEGHAVKYHDSVRHVALTEWLVSNSIRHPAVMRFDNIDDQFNITMTLGDGDLHDAISNNLYTIDQLYEIMKQVLCGLDAMHSRKFAHNDIKARNIILIDHAPKIIDFGISIQYELMRTRKTIQTITHRAPEIYDKYQVHDDSTDVWAFGCTLFECLYRGPIIAQEFWKMSSPQALISTIDTSYRDEKTAHQYLLSDKAQEEFNGYLLDYEPFDSRHVMYHMMIDCLQLDPKRRLNIRQLMDKYDVHHPPHLPIISILHNMNFKQVLSKRIDEKLDHTTSTYCKKIAFEIGKTLRVISDVDVDIDELARQAVIISKCIFNFALNDIELEDLKKLHPIIGKLYI